MPFHPDGFVPALGETLGVFNVKEFQLCLHDAVPHLKEAHSGFLLVVFGEVQHPPSVSCRRHGGGVFVAVVQMDGVPGLHAEKLKVSPVCGGDFLVVLFLVEGEGFVRYLEVHVGASSASGFALRDEGEACAVADGDYVVELVEFLVGGLKICRRAFADDIVRLFFIAHLVEHFER